MRPSTGARDWGTDEEREGLAAKVIFEPLVKLQVEGTARAKALRWPGEQGMPEGRGEDHGSGPRRESGAKVKVGGRAPGPCR